MQPVRCGLGHRHKDELAQMHARVGQCQFCRIGNDAIDRNQVNIDISVNVGPCVVAMRVRIDRAFDCPESEQDVVRILRSIKFDGDTYIKKGILRMVTPCLALVRARYTSGAR